MSSRFEMPKRDNQSHGADDLQFTSMRIGGERFLFLYTRDNIDKVIATANDFANRPELCFSQDHARILIAEVRGKMRDSD